jgi:hypothetical protein
MRATPSVDEHLEEHDEESKHQGERGREERSAWAGIVTDRREAPVAANSSSARMVAATSAADRV